MIRLVLSFDSALAYWSSAGLHKPQRYFSPAAAEEALQSSHGALKACLLDEMKAASWLDALPEPLDLLVPGKDDCHVSRRARFHCWNTPVPAGAFVSIDPSIWRIRDALCGIVMSSPEFCFLQMAQVVDDLELIELGFELCGGYAVNPSGEHGLVQRAPVTTPKRLSAFVEKAKGAPGIQRARRAVKYVLAGSRSPRESRTAMLATLTRTNGGFGLPAPALNCGVQLPVNIALAVGTPTIYPDLYWGNAATVLEYDSLDWHDGYEAAEHDAQKRMAYQLLGLDVITLTKSQFNDLDIMTGMFDMLAKRLHVRRPHANARQLGRRVELHARLVRGQRRERQVLALDASEIPRVPENVELEIPWQGPGLQARLDGADAGEATGLRAREFAESTREGMKYALQLQKHLNAR